MNRPTQGALALELSEPGSAQPAAVAQIIQRVRPDVLLLNEFDVDPDGTAAIGFHDHYLAVAQGGQQPIHYGHIYIAASNTGVPSGLDLDNDGSVGGPGDAFGFGQFPGQYGFVIYSRYPIDTESIRTFQRFRWVQMPDNLMVRGLEDFFSRGEVEALRLSSKNHIDLPILINGRTVHVLAAHPTPPVFDGPEDRNGRRNHDEIRFWADYIDGESYIIDDAGGTGGLKPGALFVVMGDYNADPFDGDSFNHAILQLLDHPRITGSATDEAVTPASEGGPQQARSQAGANLLHQGNPAFDTGDFGFDPQNPGTDAQPGNLRLDYVLPSVNLTYLAGQVVWPPSPGAGFDLVSHPTSDHRLVYVDIALP